MWTKTKSIVRQSTATIIKRSSSQQDSGYEREDNPSSNQDSTQLSSLNEDDDAATLRMLPFIGYFIVTYEKYKKKIDIWRGIEVEEPIVVEEEKKGEEERDMEINEKELEEFDDGNKSVDEENSDGEIEMREQQK